MFNMIAELLVTDTKTDCVFVEDTEIEILDFHLYEVEDIPKLKIVSFYIRKGNKYGGVSFTTEEVVSLNKEHIIDAFNLAVI